MYLTLEERGLINGTEEHRQHLDALIWESIRECNEEKNNIGCVSSSNAPTCDPVRIAS